MNTTILSTKRRKKPLEEFKCSLLTLHNQDLNKHFNTIDKKFKDINSTNTFYLSNRKKSQQEKNAQTIDMFKLNRNDMMNVSKSSLPETVF